MAAPQVRVQSEALADLKTAQLTFRGHAGEQLSAIQQYLQRAWEVIQQAELHAQVVVRQCQARLQQLRQTQPTADGGEAERALRQAEEYLRTVRHHKREVEQAIHAYLRQARQLHQQLETALPQAALWLDHKVALLTHYQTVSAAPSLALAHGMLSQSPGSDPQAGESAFIATVTTFLAQMSWVRNIDWGTCLEAVMLGMAFLSGLAQAAPVPESDTNVPQPQSDYAVQAMSALSASEVEQAADALDLASERRKEAAEAGRMQKPTLTAGADPPA